MGLRIYGGGGGSDAATAEHVTTGPLTSAALSATYAPGGEWKPSTAYAVGDLITTALGDRLRCVTAHTSAPAIFTDDLPYWRPTEAPPRESTLRQTASLSKGGVIGTNGKPPIALRFDDGHEAFNTSVYPLLTARGLPSGFASISRLSTQPWADGSSGAQVLGWNKAGGVEIWSHGNDHLDPSPHDLTGTGGLYDQIVTSKAEIEAWGVRCQGWMQPGATPVGAAVPYGTDFTTLDSLDSYAMWLIRNTYPLSESYIYGARRRLPAIAFHGLNHVTVSEGMTAAVMTAAVDDAIRRGYGLEIMCHAAQLNVAGKTTLADFTTLLDYLVTKYEAGEIDLVTPSGLYFADPGTARRVDLVLGGNMETGDTHWKGTINGASWGTTSPHSGTQYLSIPNTVTSLVGTVIRPPYLIDQMLDGETFLFEGWARSNGAATTVSRVSITSYPTTTALNLSLTRTGIGTSWTRVRHAFTIPPGVDELNFALGRTSGDGIDWDDVSIRKV